jgi:hypothetical protein
MTKPSADMVEHIQYEWNMLHQTGDALKTYASTRGALLPGVWSALVESFALHLRNLHVLFRGSNHSDDVLAIDYCGAWNFDSSILDKELHEKVSSQVAHLSSKRVKKWTKPSDFDWNIDTLTAEVDRLMRLLIAQAQAAGDLHLGRLRDPGSLQQNAIASSRAPSQTSPNLTNVSTPSGSQTVYQSTGVQPHSANMCARTAPPDDCIPTKPY